MLIPKNTDSMRHRSSLLASIWWHGWSDEWQVAHSTAGYDVDELRAGLMQSSLLDLRSAMSPYECGVYAKLPGVLTVYRGFVPPGRGADGLSWTLNRRTAEFFAGAYSRRFHAGDGVPDGATIFTGKTRKAGCILLCERGEDEIVTPRVTVTASEPARPWNGGPPPALYPPTEQY
jgi:hypothetical protein